MPVPDLIYDVGMNNGDDTAYYLWLGFRVVAIEANPFLVEHAKARFACDMASGRLTILNVGIADREGQLPFWICQTNSRWSSFNRTHAAWDESPHHQIQVQCSRFKTVLAKYGVPHFCKIDIQGNDHLCVEDIVRGDVLKFISIEATDIHLLERLRAAGYSLFKCISQFHFIPIQLPPTVEQQRVERIISRRDSLKFKDRIFRKLGGRHWLQGQLERTRRLNGWSFPDNSSGPWGNDTLGQWLTYDEMFKTYGEFLRRRNDGQKSVFWFNKPYSFWADFHAQFVG
jgi:FkbM family methyltransferase